MELNSHGIVLATEKCKFFFFLIESQDEGKTLTMQLVALNQSYQDRRHESTLLRVFHSRFESGVNDARRGTKESKRSDHEHW
jgi:hypothetical protein